MSPLRRIPGLLVGLGMVIGLVALSSVPYRAGEDHDAFIRLSWRTPGELVNECRRLEADELERLPMHMRREEVCEGRMMPYRLLVTLNDRVVVEEVVRAAGAREDRPLYVYREIPVPPGDYRLGVRWERELPADPEPLTSSAHSRGHHVPPRLTLDATLSLASGQVSLITYDLDRRVFVARGHGVVDVTTE